MSEPIIHFRATALANLASLPHGDGSLCGVAIRDEHPDKLSDEQAETTCCACWRIYWSHVTMQNGHGIQAQQQGGEGA